MDCESVSNLDLFDYEVKRDVPPHFQKPARRDEDKTGRPMTVGMDQKSEAACVWCLRQLNNTATMGIHCAFSFILMQNLV